MQKQTKITGFVLALAFAVGAAFFFSQPVFAQDIIPPADEPAPLTEPVSPPTEPETSSPSETPLVEETVAPSEEPAPETSLEQIVLLSEDGTVLPMASQEAASVLLGDPYFTCSMDTIDGIPDGICTYVGLGSIQDAINDFPFLGGSGAIRVLDAGGSPDYSGTITVNGIPGLTGIIGEGSHLVSFTGSVLIINQLSAFTFSGFNIASNIDGPAVIIDSNSGTLTLTDLVIRNTNGNGDGLHVSNHTGAVNLSGVTSDRNTDFGATINATGNITIYNSSFDTNSDPFNLNVSSTNGSILLDGVSASNNVSGDGARLISKTGITVRNSNFNSNYDGVSNGVAGYGLTILSGNRGPINLDRVYTQFNDEYGLYLETASGAVTAKNITASYNYYGMMIDNCLGSPACTTTAGTITLTNADVSSNTRENLQILANGNVTLTNVISNSSSTRGGTVITARHAVSAATVSVISSSFNSNFGVGLRIEAKGTVTLHAVNAQYNANAGSGVEIDNSYGTGGVTALATLGSNTFSYNPHFGLLISSKGAVTLNGVYAYNNTASQIYIDNSLGTSGVTINSGSSNSGPSQTGLSITTRGAVLVTGFSSSYNAASYGVTINNSLSTSRAGVTIKTSAFNNNFLYGLFVNSLGSVSITTLEASFNGGFGAYIDTQGAVSVTGGIFNTSINGLAVNTLGTITLKDIAASGNSTALTLNNAAAPTSSPGMTLTNIDVDSNSVRGLEIQSKGPISITNISASNMSGGTVAVNINTLGSVTITATTTGQNYVENNTGTGIIISTYGNVLVNKLIATYNSSGNGLLIDNSTGTGTVTVSNTTINHSGLDGLIISSKGNITLTNVDSTHNPNGNGATIDNTFGTGGVTVNGGSASNWNVFSYNWFGGLIIYTTGPVNVAYIEAVSNKNLAGTIGIGLDLQSIMTGNVVGNNIYAAYNGLQGVAINSRGTVTLSNVTTYSNNAQGIYLNNSYAPSARNVSLTNIDSGYNGGMGLYVNTLGAVSLKDAYLYYSTTGFGAYIDAPGTGGVTISRTAGKPEGYSNGNQVYGVYISTAGPVSVSGMYFGGNHSYGLYIDNQLSVANAPVTLKDLSASSNEGYGIMVQTEGNVTATNITSTGNGLVDLSGDGLYILNNGTGTISVTNGVFKNNYGYGLYASGYRAITVNHVDAADNQHNNGIYLNNASGTGNVTLSATGSATSEFSGNLLSNIFIRSSGDIILSRVSSTTSPVMGADLQNTSGMGKVTISTFTAYNNTSFGLWVQTNGAITINGLDVQYSSTANGVTLINNTGTAPVSISNAISFSNSGDGFEINTGGNVTFSSVTANDNSGLGVDLVAVPASNVTITRGTFNVNGQGGFAGGGGNTYILNSITANDNQSAIGFGVSIATTAPTGSIKLLSSYGGNTFNRNWGNGLALYTDGGIALNNVTAIANGNRGVSVQSYVGGPIAITNATVLENSYGGMVVSTSGNFTGTNLVVMNNGFSSDAFGINLNMGGGTALIQNSTINGNARYGVSATMGAGTLTLKKSAFSGNNRQNRYDADQNVNMVSGTLVIIR